MSYLCFYHDNDGDERGWRRDEPEISCQACRAEAVRRARQGGHKHFTLDEVKAFEKANPDAMQTHAMNWR